MAPTGEHMPVRTKWLLEASTLAAFLLPTGSLAQVAPQPGGETGSGISAGDLATDTGSQDIVVTGIRSGIERAVKIKRDADSIVDVISAEDIGRFPDVNVAESVQRISGVQINRTRGEGRSVNIRGLPDTFTLVTLNGRSVPNALNDLFTPFSRSFDFSALPSEFVRTLEVYKSPTADLDDGGLAGTVNIRTPRALDLGKRVFALSAQAEHESNSGRRRRGFQVCSPIAFSMDDWA